MKKVHNYALTVLNVKETYRRTSWELQHLLFVLVNASLYKSIDFHNGGWLDIANRMSKMSGDFAEQKGGSEALEAEVEDLKQREHIIVKN